ncbi:MAG: DegV family protein [Bacilli bacterium]
MKIAYILDSMTTLTKKFREEHNIFIMPIEVILDGQSYEENVDITADTFYENIETYQDLKTSQPALGKVVDLFQKLITDGFDKIVVFALSSKGSGAYATCTMAASMVDHPIEVIDTLSASFILDGLMKARIIDNETPEQTENRRKRSKFVVVPRDLKQLHKSGRVSGMSFILGSLLKIQPILEMVEGEVVLQEKVRRKKDIEKYVVQQLAKGPIENNTLMIQHTLEPEEAEKWKELLLQTFPNLNIQFGIVPVSVAVHNGCGTLIFSWFYEQ